MSDLVRRQSEMSQRVDNFGTENVDLYKNKPKAVAAFAIVKNGVQRLVSLGALHASAAQTKFSFTALRQSLRESLYSRLTGIAQTARQVKRENPDFVNKFKAPHDNRNDGVILDTARAFAEDLPPVKELFTDLGEEDDFIEDLVEETEAFAQAINSQDTANRRRIGSAAEIDDVLGEILPAVQRLKVMMPKLLKDNPDKLAQWLAASHLERPPKRKKDNQPTP